MTGTSGHSFPRYFERLGAVEGGQFVVCEDKFRLELADGALVVHAGLHPGGLISDSPAVKLA